MDTEYRSNMGLDALNESAVSVYLVSLSLQKGSSFQNYLSWCKILCGGRKTSTRFHVSVVFIFVSLGSLISFDFD